MSETHIHRYVLCVISPRMACFLSTTSASKQVIELETGRTCELYERRKHRTPYSGFSRTLRLREAPAGEKGSGSSPEEHVDAFGRDPKKEAEAWKETARELLETDTVQEAIHKHIEREHLGAQDAPVDVTEKPQQSN